MRFTSPRAAVLVAFLIATTFAVVLADYSFTIYGDWGVKSTWAPTLARVSEKHNSQFIAAIGDNFYREHGKIKTPFGVKSVNDPKWKRIFESVYTQPFFKKTWYVIAGNHDYNGNQEAQVQYTKKSDRWYFPSMYYKFSKTSGPITMDFFMLDTTPLYYPDAELKRHFGVKAGKDWPQLKWLEAQLKASKATWKIVMGHHQIYTGHGGNRFLRDHVAPLLNRHGVAAYINGHLHNMIHVKNRLHYMTVGNAAFQQPAGKGKALFAYPSPTQYKSSLCSNHACRGFAIFTVKDRNNAQVSYYNKAGSLLRTIPIKNR